MEMEDTLSDTYTSDTKANIQTRTHLLYIITNNNNKLVHVSWGTLITLLLIQTLVQ